MNFKITKLVSLLLTLILMAGMAHALTVETNAEEITQVSAPMYGRSALEALENSTALLYAYDQLVAGVENGDAEISVYNGTDNITMDEIEIVMDAYRRDYTYHFWLGNSYSVSSYSYSVVRVIPSYLLTGEELETAKAKFNAAANEILSGIHSGMSEYEKELYLHEKLAEKITYTMGTTHAHNAYGALVEGKSVCEGYAESLQYLLQRCGIQSFIIEGGGYNPGTGGYEAHAWNVVKIDGNFAHVDLTWDDQGEKIYHAYFNVTDSMIQQDHMIAATAYALPVCSSDSNFYFKKNDAILDSYTVERMGKILKDNKGDAHVYVPGNVQTFLDWYVENIRDIAKAAGVQGGFSYGYSILGKEMVLTIPQLQVEEHAHDYEAVVTLPTCTADGYTTYTCDCGDSYVADEVAALGHDAVVDKAVAATCTADGKTEGSHCSRCSAVLKAQEPVPATGHTEAILPKVEPTCTSTGLTEGKKCSACGEIVAAQEVIPALAHTEAVDEAVAATCKATGLTEGKHCSVCNTVLVAQILVEKLPHTEEKIPAVAPTCTSTGLTEGKKCSVCGEILTAQENVAALDHAEEVIPPVVATCTTSGLTEGKKCSTCGTTLLAQEVISALGHTPAAVPGSSATCTESGLTDGEKCSACGVITKEQTVIPATGHVWNNGVCNVCGKECEHSYKVEGGTCIICGGGCAHDYITKVIAPSCTAQGYTTYTCTICGNTYNDDYEDALGHAWLAATCTAAKTCSRCGTTEGEANGHNYVSKVTAPTCEAKGYTTHTCSVCGHSYADSETEALGHKAGTPVEEDRKEPTCTASGHVWSVTYCTVCEEELCREEILIPADGHINTDAVTAPTCTKQGYTTHTCKICGEQTVDSYTPAAGHSYSEWGVVTDATCTEAGERRRYCENCDHFETEALTVLGHDWDGGLCDRCGESRYQVELALADSDEIDSVWVDGKEYPVTKTGSGIRVKLEDANATNLVTYAYNDPNAADVHTQYPTGMRVWLLNYENEAYTAVRVPEFDDLLQYSGSAIRVTGKKGIRMITSIDKGTRTALMNEGLAGCTLVEYGTAVAWASNLSESKPLILGADDTISNFAYKKDVADPIFQDTGSLIQYTNVLVGFSNEQCKPDLVMRPYIILENAEGRQITIYGGQVVRSIGYIAYQNRDAFEEGTDAYDYVWSIIHNVYGDKYD